MENIKLTEYGNNHYNKARKLEIGNYKFWYSYDTIIAFQTPGNPIQVSENVWGPTTGRHMNSIDQGNKKGRLSRAEFTAELIKILIKITQKLED